MAKRKRLTPANPDFLSTSESNASPKKVETLIPEPISEGLEATKHLLGGALPRTRPRAPIAEVAGEASAAAALKELSEEMTRVRDEGRLIQSLALSDIDTGHLVRDRMFVDEEELASLMESLRRRGQQTPIEVVDRGQPAAPRYGLISGWRRIAALTRLNEEDPSISNVLAIVRAPQSASDAYVAMVEENEIRVGLSYYERARVSLKAVEQGVYPDLKTALNTLFGNVSRAKRSKVKSFTRVVEALDGVLSFPTQIGERLGLTLAKRLENEPDLAWQLRANLEKAPARSAEAEQAKLSFSIDKPDAKPNSEQSMDIVRERVPSKAGTEEAATIKVSYDHEHQSLTLSGSGVTPELHVAVETWLRRR